MKKRSWMALAAWIALASHAGCNNDLAKADELLASGDTEGAAAIYQARLDRKPGDGAATIGIARARYTSALEKTKTGQDTVAVWREVVELMQDAVLVNPPPEGVQAVTQDLLANCLSRLGHACFAASDWDCAAESLAAAGDKGESNAELWSTLARAEAARGQTEAAMKAALAALKIDQGDVKLMLDAAYWAKEAKQPWMHHRFFAMAQKHESAGLRWLAPADIAKGLTKRYPALSLVNDTLALFLFEEKVDSLAWDGLLAREAMISDMDKFVSKKPPAAFAADDKPRLGWAVYHYYNTTGVVFAWLGDKERAGKWFRKADKIAAGIKIVNPSVDETTIATQVGWAKSNLDLVK